MKRISLVFLFVVVLAMASLAIAGDKMIYTVKQGDTLGELMYSWRVQGIEINKLYSWNPELGTQVKIGQEIVYYLPDRPEQQDAKKMSEQDVKKIVKETLAQAEAARVREITPPAPAVVPSAPEVSIVEPEVEAHKFGEKLKAIFFLLAITLIAFFLSFLVLRLIGNSVRKKHIKAAEKAAETETLARAEVFSRELLCAIKDANEAEAKAKAETILEERWVDAETNNGTYDVLIVKKGDAKWYTPFMTIEDGNKPLFRSDFQAAKKAVRTCMKNPHYADEILFLLAAGGIKEIK